MQALAAEFFGFAEEIRWRGQSFFRLTITFWPV